MASDVDFDFTTLGLRVTCGFVTGVEVDGDGWGADIDGDGWGADVDGDGWGADVDGDGGGADEVG